MEKFGKLGVARLGVHRSLSEEKRMGIRLESPVAGKECLSEGNLTWTVQFLLLVDINNNNK